LSQVTRVARGRFEDPVDDAVSSDVECSSARTARLRVKDVIRAGHFPMWPKVAQQRADKFVLIRPLLIDEGRIAIDDEDANLSLIDVIRVAELLDLVRAHGRKGPRHEYEKSLGAAQIRQRNRYAVLINEREIRCGLTHEGMG